MKRIAWLTDIHLDFLMPWEINAFLMSVRAQHPDAVMITGDIAPAPRLPNVLLGMTQNLAVPIYFVLGNHDYYDGDIPTVREMITDLTREQVDLHWLPATGVVELTPEIGLVGHDGWADGRYGKFMASPVILNDYVLIRSLRTPSAEERLRRLNALGDEAADHLRGVLPEAARHYQRVFVLTHPPPFVEACWHNGKTPTEDDAYLPHFSCKAVGDVLLEVASEYSQVAFTVLCGHTHGEGVAQIRDNLLVFTGAAEYGEPAVQQVFEFVR